MIRFKHELNY